MTRTACCLLLVFQHLLILATLALPLPRGEAATSPFGDPVRFHQSTKQELFQSKSVSSCTMNSATSSPVKILQRNGQSEYFLRVDVCPTDESSLNFSYRPSSSSRDVLPTSDIVLQVVSSGKCQNVTAILQFDSMVGQTLVSLDAIDSANRIRCSLTLRFIIVGFTIFQEVSTTSRINAPPQLRKLVLSDEDKVLQILSGDGNVLEENYLELLGGNPRYFSVKVQYADGSDSYSRSPSYVSNSLLSNSLDWVAGETEPLLPNNPRCPSVQKYPEVSLRGTDCSTAFAVAGDEILFALTFKEFRDGKGRILFNWDSLTQFDNDLGDESFENILNIEVSGNSPPVVVNIEPKNYVFFRAGGEIISLTFDNVENSVERELLIGEFVFSEIPGSFRKLTNGLFTAKFLTVPGSGSFKVWTVRVTFGDGKVKESVAIEKAKDQVISYASRALTITDISPKIAREGDTIVLTGYFDGLNLSVTRHYVLFGNKPVTDLEIEPNVSPTKVTMTVPPRSLVGSSFSVIITVLMNIERAETTAFSYVADIPMTLEIQVYGATYSGELEQHVLGSCDTSDFHAKLPSGVPYPNEFEWLVVLRSDASRENLLLSFTEFNSKNSTIRLYPQIFGGRTGVFDVSVSCFVQGLRLDATVALSKSTGPIVGLTLLDQQPRGVLIPNIPLRLSTLVIPPPPECYSGTFEIMYVWTFGGNRYSYSYLNSSEVVDTGPTPTRIGREFIIPQSYLTYGNHSVTLSVFMMDSPTIRGFASTSFLIQRPELIAIIGHGSSLISYSSAEDLYITGERSYNPDTLVSRGTSIDTYNWSCSVSLPNNLSYVATDCDKSLLPSASNASFTVERLSLQEQMATLQSLGSSGRFLIHYSLEVGVGVASSSPAYFVADIRTGDRKLAKVSQVRILDNRGNERDWHEVGPFEDVLLSPRSPNVSWTFNIVSPPSARNMLNNSNDLITLPGYYVSSDPPQWQRAPLGIRGNTLRGAQEYEIAILVRDIYGSMMDGETRIRIRTRDTPKLVLPALSIVLGNTRTVFVASAKVNLDHDDFLYHFFLIGEDEEESCLDGCSGKSVIQFRITQAGKYSLLVRLRDVHGRALLDEVFFSETLSVSEFVSAAQSTIDRETSIARKFLSEARRAGDHGTVQLVSAHLAIRSIGAKEIDKQTLEIAADAMYQVVSNTAPSTMGAKSFVATAALFSRIGQPLLFDQNVLLKLLSWVDKAIMQVPLTESLDVVNELRSFYNHSVGHISARVLNSAARQIDVEYDSDWRTLLIDMYSLLRKHFAVALSRDVECGAIRHVDTRLDNENENENEASSWPLSRKLLRRPKYDFLRGYGPATFPLYSSLTIATLCSPEQGVGIRGDRSQFRWCDKLLKGIEFSMQDGSYYIDPSKKRIFSLLETPGDFRLMRSVGVDTQLDSDFIVWSSIGRVGLDGYETMSFPRIRECLSITTTMKRLGMTASKGCVSAEAYQIVGLGGPFEEGGNETLTMNVSVADVQLSHDGSSDVIIRSSDTGTFGAVAKECPSDLRKPTITVPETDVEYGYLVAGSVLITTITVAVTWVSSSSTYVGFIGAAASV